GTARVRSQHLTTAPEASLRASISSRQNGAVTFWSLRRKDRSENRSLPVEIPETHVDLRDAAGSESTNLLPSRSGVGAAQVNAVAGSNPARRAVGTFPLVDRSSFSQRLNLQFQPGFAFVFIRSNPECDIPRRRRKRRVRGVKIDRPLMVIALAQKQNQMFVIYHTRRRNRLDFARKKKRRRISVAKRLQHLVPAEKIEVEIGEGNLVIEPQTGLQTFIREQLARNPTELRGEYVDFLFINR